jgi:hypothetical protein
MKKYTKKEYVAYYQGKKYEVFGGTKLEAKEKLAKTLNVHKNLKHYINLKLVKGV